MEMNIKKTKVMRISRKPFPVKIMIDQKQRANVESFNIWVAFYQVMEDALVKFNRRIAMAKAAFNKKRALFTCTLDLELKK